MSSMLNDLAQFAQFTPLGISALSLLILWFVLRNQANKPNESNAEVCKLLKNLKENDFNHVESKLSLMDTKLDKLIESNNQQNYILQDIRTILQKR